MRNYKSVLFKINFKKRVGRFNTFGIVMVGLFVNIIIGPEKKG